MMFGSWREIEGERMKALGVWKLGGKETDHERRTI
jgi:hypothetical protein